MTKRERKKHRHISQEKYRAKVLRFTLQFNINEDMEAREWFEVNGKSGDYLKKIDPGG